MKKYFLSLLILLLVGFTVSARASNGAYQDSSSQQGQPNLLFIIADQFRFDVLSIAGHEVLETPNLDRLAEEGVWFSNAYTQAAVCAPARATMLTGYTVEHTGVKTNQLAESPKGSGIMSQPTFDEILAENGYRAEHYGKWHLPAFHAEVYQNPKVGSLPQKYLDYLDEHVPIRPLKPGELYDTFTGRPYKPNPIDKRYNYSEEELKKWEKGRNPQTDLHGKRTIPSEHSLTAFRSREVMDAIERLEPKDPPFSITCSFHHPHAPMLPTEDYYGLFSHDNIKLPPSINDDMVNSPYRKANGRLANSEYADPDKIKYMISDYYGLVKEIDDWVGKILDKLDALGIADNTLVVFTSDHGEMLGAHGMREKNIFYEESAHIPLIVRFPDKIKQNVRIDEDVSNIDLFATILDYLGQEAHPSDGKSLRGLIEGADTNRSDYIVTEWNYRGDVQPNYMIVKNGWKMFIPYSPGSQVINALYNLNEDPYEMHNLIGKDPERVKYKDKIKELKKDLLEWLQKNDSKHYAGVLKREIIK